MEEPSVKLNFITFIKYEKIWFDNVIWIRNYKSLQKMFSFFYDKNEVLF